MTSYRPAPRSLRLRAAGGVLHPGDVVAAVRRPRTLKHGDTFGVFDHYGDIVPAEGGTEGIYHQDTRYLSGLQLLINGRRPLLLSSIVQDNALLTADLTNPDFFDAAGRLRLPKDAIHIVREVHLAGAGL